MRGAVRRFSAFLRAGVLAVGRSLPEPAPAQGERERVDRRRLLREAEEIHATTSLTISEAIVIAGDKLDAPESQIERQIVTRSRGKDAEHIRSQLRQQARDLGATSHEETHETLADWKEATAP